MHTRSAKQWRAAVPTEPSTCSFWHSELDTSLPDRTNDPLPQSADYVIIGSGISGALIAYDLIRSLPSGTSIVIVEARFAVSGATGRNGGHIKPGRIHSFHDWSKVHGSDVAAQQVALEQANYEETVHFIQDQGLAQEVDLVLLRAVDACMNQEALDEIKVCWNGLKKAGAVMDDIEFHDGSTAADMFRVPQCLAAVSYPAASLWPYKLAIALLRKAEALGAHLYTHTGVLSIGRSELSQPWILETSRGTISANNVIHATNGYASSILPELTEKLVPVKAHAAAAIPPRNYYNTPLQSSFGFLWGADFDYLIQRQAGSKHLIYGGRDLAAGGDPAIGVGDSDDSFLYPGHVESLTRFPEETFEGWSDASKSGRHADTQIWSGIMGFVVDDFPYLGAVPGKPGQYICAGYNGSGMARAFLCTKALCQLIRGEEVDKRIPSMYFDLEKRWASDEKASVKFGHTGADQARL